MRNLKEQVKKAFCYQKLFWPLTVWINCFSDLKNFALNFKSFFQLLEQFVLTVDKNNFGKKIPNPGWLLNHFNPAIPINYLVIFSSCYGKSFYTYKVIKSLINLLLLKCTGEWQTIGNHHWFELGLILIHFGRLHYLGKFLD